jgi:hypothetical protein
MPIQFTQLGFKVNGNPSLVLKSQKNDHFDSYSIAFPSVYKEDEQIFLYYTGAPDRKWSFASIGVAWSKDGNNFSKASDCILVSQHSSFLAREAVTPAVIKIGSNYFMVVSGRKYRYNHRIIGLAVSDDPKGPFNLIKILYLPTDLWEGYSIDNGTTLVKTSDKSFLVYYSNCAAGIRDIFLRKTIRRCIGILEVEVNGLSAIEISVKRLTSGPIVVLNGKKGDWNESVFCPGYFSNSSCSVLFFAASKYSSKPAFQSIGFISVDSPRLGGVLSVPKQIINGSKFTETLEPIAFDSPSPLQVDENHLLLFYSIKTKTQSWQIMSSVLEICPVASSFRSC